MTSVAHGGPFDPSTELAIRHLTDLIRFPSVSSASNVDANAHVAALLKSLGFAVTTSQYQDPNGVTKSNLVAVRQPSSQYSPQDSSPIGLAYLCHTDVVPAQSWKGPTPASPKPASPNADPFKAVRTEDRIYGRGACDMKGSLAAMLAAIERVPQSKQTAPLWVVCTADEEVGFEGAKQLAQHCPAFQSLVAHDPVAIIGEPTELQVVHAHKGIGGIKLHAKGKAGHSATALGVNANEAMVPVLQTIFEICQRTRTDESLLDDRFTPPTLSWNFGVSDHARAINITPDRSDAWISFRTMPEIDGKALVAEVAEVAKANAVEVRMIDGCGPMWTSPDNPHIKSMELLSQSQAKTVSYATDGGVWNELSHRMIIGPGSISQAHTVDEWISIDQLQQGIDLYQRAIEHWTCG